MKRFWISLVAAGLLTVAAIAPVAGQDTVDFDLDEVDDSGVTGSVTMTADNGSTTVSIELDGAPEDGVHPVHIHEGTCDDLGDVAYPLEDVVDGQSESTVDVELSNLLGGGYAINVHLSAEEMATWVACGNVPEAQEDDDDAVEEDDDAAEDDDAVTEDDDEADDAEDVMPAAGSTGGLSTEAAMLMTVLLAGGMIGGGFALRNFKAQRA